MISGITANGLIEGMRGLISVLQSAYTKSTTNLKAIFVEGIARCGRAIKSLLRIATYPVGADDIKAQLQAMGTLPKKLISTIKTAHYRKQLEVAIYNKEHAKTVKDKRRWHVEVIYLQNKINNGN